MAEAEYFDRTLPPEDEEDGSVEAVGEMALLSAAVVIKPSLLEYHKYFFSIPSLFLWPRPR